MYNNRIYYSNHGSEKPNLILFCVFFQIFYDIDAVDPLKTVASSPNATASKLAAQALKIIGEDIPHKLTPQVPVWNSGDVAHWVKQVLT